MSRERKKVLVIGGSGFIGSHLLLELSRGFDVISYASDVLDITKLETFKALPKDVEIVFNLAAHVDLSNERETFESLFLTNVIGIQNVLEFSRRRGMKRVINSSSVLVYPKPRSYYALSKKMAEDVCSYFREFYGLDVVILRYSSVYGKGQKQNSVLPTFINKAKEDEDLVVYGKGKRLQDFVHVKDVVKANILAAKKRGKFRDGVFNIGSGKLTSMRELAETVADVFESKSRIVLNRKLPEEEGLEYEKLADANQAFGYLPKYSLRKGIEELRKETK
jgi:UDP-glucose 4-epimerase